MKIIPSGLKAQGWAINANLHRYLLPIDYLYALDITAKENAE
jgi:hypothetical protein